MRGTASLDFQEGFRKAHEAFSRHCDAGRLGDEAKVAVENVRVTTMRLMDVRAWQARGEAVNGDVHAILDDAALGKLDRTDLLALFDTCGEVHRRWIRSVALASLRHSDAFPTQDQSADDAVDAVMAACEAWLLHERGAPVAVRWRLPPKFPLSRVNKRNGPAQIFARFRL